MDTITEQFANYYFHTPYCETKCHYCDFFSLPEALHVEQDRLTAYDAICRELALFRAAIGPKVDTVFFGGGTPSLAPPAFIETLLKQLPLDSSSEVTMEGNPSSITLERARQWRSYGVNRFSMGVQALDNERLKWLGRIHDKSEVYAALDALFEAGFENVSIDYIVGVPGQTTAKIQQELGEVLKRYPAIRHISAYLLTLKTANPKFTQLPDEDEQLAHLRTVSETLQSHGFEQYEISNFAKPQSRARHNENYWLGGAYLGIGPSAHSYFLTSQKRSKNWASLGKYIELVQQQKTPAEWDETLTAEQLRLEYLMLRLRRSAGIELSEYKTIYKRDLIRENEFWMEQCVKRGLCQVDSHLRLTADGFFLSDQILSKIK